MADGDNSVDALQGGFGEASTHLAAAGSGGEDDAKISMKWNKNQLSDGLPCKAAVRECRASPITRNEQHRSEPVSGADHASIWLSQPMSSTYVGSVWGKRLRIPPMDLIPAADMIPLSTST